MTGASLSRAAASYLLAAWETKGEISFSRQIATNWSTDKLGSAIEVAPRGKYPVAFDNGHWIVCVSWKEGSELKWRLFDHNDRPLGEPGSAPAPSGDRHAGAVTRAGDFVLFP
jgi:hypothetical protein